jgi:hypothetical protein
MSAYSEGEIIMDDKKKLLEFGLPLLLFIVYVAAEIFSRSYPGGYVFLLCILSLLLAFLFHQPIREIMSLSEWDDMPVFLLVVLIALGFIALGMVPAFFLFAIMPREYYFIYLLLMMVVPIASTARGLVKDGFSGKLMIEFLILALVFFYAGLIPFFIFLPWIPAVLDPIKGLPIENITGYSIIILLMIGLQIGLYKTIDKFQDYSGGNEYSSTAYWATADGKKYLNATKRQTGEWHPPMSTFGKLMIFNILLIAGGVIASASISFPTSTPLWIGCIAYCLLTGLLTALVYFMGKEKESSGTTDPKQKLYAKIKIFLFIPILLISIAALVFMWQTLPPRMLGILGGIGAYSFFMIVDGFSILDLNISCQHKFPGILKIFTSMKDNLFDVYVNLITLGLPLLLVLIGFFMDNR